MPPELAFGTLSLITLLLFVGATGKSAQIPLYTWLPDAMEGPTPVSALIHAATMVTAGVYMIGRNAVLFEHAPITLGVIAAVGAATALFAGTIGLVQNDIKRVLAYSTVSQLGYMFLAMGVGAFGAGVFHLYTHAFFKACLFLGSGAVIHALHGQQDIRHMGGLKKSPADHLLDVRGGVGRDRRRAAAGRILLEGRDSLRDLRQRAPVALGRRRAHVAAHGDLHVPARVPHVPRCTARSACWRRSRDMPDTRRRPRASVARAATANICTTHRPRWRWRSSCWRSARWEPGGSVFHMRSAAITRWASGCTPRSRRRPKHSRSARRP